MLLSCGPLHCAVQVERVLHARVPVINCVYAATGLMFALVLSIR
jgi:hypothetical protein